MFDMGYNHKLLFLQNQFHRYDSIPRDSFLENGNSKENKINNAIKLAMNALQEVLIKI